MKLDHLSELQGHLLRNKNIVDLSGKVDEDMALRFKQSFEYLVSIGCPDIRINFCSGGGRSGIGFDIYYLIRDYPGKVTGWVIGMCKSSATTILQACDRRIAFPSGGILVHHSSSDKFHAGMFSPDGTPNESGKRRIQKLLETQDQKIKILLTRMKIDGRDALLELFGENRTLTASEALEFGLIDEVRDPCNEPFVPKE